MKSSSLDHERINSHEALFVRSFVTEAKQKRFLQLLSSKKGRAKLRQNLAHYVSFQEKFAKPIPASAQSVEAILQLLGRKNAPNACYVISESDDLDGRNLELSEVIKKTVGAGMGTIVSCIPGVLAYFEGKKPATRIVLEKL